MSIRGKKNYLRLGRHNVICDRCGNLYKDNELRKEWQGFMVCAPCYEIRNPQDFLVAMPDQRPRSYYRPDPADIYLDHSIQPEELIP